jgi:hypothetical protein
VIWAWLVVPLLPWLLRDPAGPGRRSALRALIGRIACGLAWFAGVHGAVPALGDAAACAIYRDTRGVVLGAGAAMVYVMLVPAVAWGWRRRAPRRRDPLLAGAAFALGAALTLSCTPYGGPEPARFGRVLAMPPGTPFVENVPSRPVTRIDFNDHGFRGPSFSDEKPAGTERGVLIGDSFVMGSGVALPDTLAESLRRVLADRAPRQAYEILNLGIGGDNLPSHVDVYEEAVRRLAPDFVVLCLTLPNDMSAYDDQVVRREERRLGGYTLAKWAFGPWFATWMWSAGRVATGVTPEAIAVLDREIGRLVRSRGGPAPPILVFTYRDPDQRVLPALLGIPGAHWVPPPPEDPSFFLPVDGHPTGAGNRAFAARIADTMREVPELAAPFSRP